MASCSFYFDIGNTNTKIAVYGSDGTSSVYSLPTNDRQTADDFGLRLLEAARHAGAAPENAEACVGSSVVPGMAQLVRSACARFLRLPLLLAPEDIPIPLENRYARPYEVGADRLVGALAARRLFPQAASIISVDYGTATTFDCVEGDAYLGGLICPGVLSSASALAANTAKLPRISLEVEKGGPQPGLSTAESLNHGFVFGFAAMTEGLVARLKEGLRGPTVTVGTGGFAESLAKASSVFDAVRPDLLLEGLRTLHLESMGR